MAGTTRERRVHRGVEEAHTRARRSGAARRPGLASWLLAMLLLCSLAACSSAAASPAGAGLGVRPFAEAAPKITLQPKSVTAEEGTSASFTAAASGTPTVQWELSTDAGVTWVQIGGATAGTYTIASTVLSESGHQFRATFTNGEGKATTTSKAVTLTVTQKPVVTVQPQDAYVQEGHETSFESRASGTPAPTVQWQNSTDGGTTFKNLTGSTQNVLKLSNVNKALNGSKYRAVFKNSAGTATSEAGTLHIVDPPRVTRAPLDTTVTEGESARFAAEAIGNPTPTEQWERSIDKGATWQPIEGATSTELTIPSTSPSENGYQYRAVFTNIAATVNSSAATLTVQGIPVVTQQPQKTTVTVGADATFEALGTGLPTPTVQWEVSTNGGGTWTSVPGATSNKLTISNAQVADNGHLYRAVFKNAAGSRASSGALLTVSATNYRAYGWGLNTRGQVGVNSAETSVPAPTPINGMQFVTAVSAGSRHSLALLADGTVYAWGFNGHGQLGNKESPSLVRAPLEIEGLSGVKAIAAGGSHSLALLSNGTVMAWGDDESGQLGDGGNVDSEVPVPVGGLSGVIAIAAGEEQSLALLSDGTVMAWGNNERGQLGNGKTKSSNTPVPVKGLSGVSAIAAGGQFSLALLSDGTVQAWGDDTHDQLANVHVLEAEEPEEGTGHSSQVPVEAEGLSGVGAIAAGRTHALALITGGTVKAWGQDSEGELGNGAREPAVNTPVAVTGLSNVSAISAGFEDSAALLQSGTVMTWGMNNNGSLGTGATGEPSDVPVQAANLGQATGISAGGGQMLAFGEALPSVTGISPQAGPAAGGGTVTITGVNLGAAGAVRFGASPATSFTVNSPSSITATAPAGSGTVDVTVTTPSGTSPAGAADRYSYRPAPALSKVSPKGGPATGGTTVAITGTNLTGATEVRFGGVAASQFTVLSATSMTAVAPANGSGAANVTVTTVGGTSPVTSKARFKYAPVIESVTPSNGPLAGGTSVTIAGAGFAPGTGVTKFKFGKSTAKTVECASATTCTVVTPTGKALGTVDITATANSANSSPEPGDRFTYE